MLHQKYVVEKATMLQIAKEFSCSKNAIRNALIRAGIAPRQRSGHSIVKYGIKCSRGRKVEDSTEHRVIQTIASLRSDGMSYDKIASVLTQMGVPTKTRRRKWNGGCVRSIYLLHKGLPR